MKLWLALALVGCASATPSTSQDAPVVIDAAVDAKPDANTCVTQPCDLHEQCGCSAVQACDIDFTDLMGTECRGITAMGMEADTCSSVAACARGYVCVGSGANASCQKYCNDAADCEAPRGQCVIALVDQNQMPIPNAVTCSSNCDPAAITNAQCPATWSCDLFSSTFQGAPKTFADCRKAGTAAQGAACSATVACAAGLTCVNTGTASECAKICPRPQNTGCPGGTTCGSFTTPFVIAGQEYGACL